jgi:hypothetical protein
MGRAILDPPTTASRELPLLSTTRKVATVFQRPFFPGRGGHERGSGVKLELEIMSILGPREQLRRFRTLRVLAVQHAAQLLVFRL